MIQIILKKALETKHLIPILALVVFFVTKALGDLGFGLTVLSTVFLGVSILSSVHHAEIIAHKIGEGLGTLVLALSVTIAHDLCRRNFNIGYREINTASGSCPWNYSCDLFCHGLHSLGLTRS